MQRGQVFEFRKWNKPDPVLQCRAHEDIPALPVLSETILYIELSVGHRPVELDELTDVVLRDPGTTAQILRTAAREADFHVGCAGRVEDCIAALGVEGCLNAVKDEASVLGGRRPEVRNAWGHAREIAENCRLLAATTDTGVPLRDAYLVGLFHEFDTLPPLLGWPAQSMQIGAPALAQSWSLPECVRDYFQERQAGTCATPWSDMVRSAHAMHAPPAPIAVANFYPLSE